MKHENLLENDLKILFYYKNTTNNRLIKNILPVSINIYKNVILSNTKKFNINCTDQHWCDLYNRYCVAFYEDKKCKLTDIGIYSLSNVRRQFYLDRGWNEIETTERIKERQYRVFNDESKQKWKNTWESNREKNILSLKKSNIICKDYYDLNFSGMTNKDVDISISNEQRKRSIMMYEKLKKEGKKKISNVSIEYFKSFGMTLTEAIEAQRIRQQTCTKERYIKRYGIDDGTRKWHDKNNKYKKTMSDKSDEEKIEILKKKLKNQNFYSNESFIFFKKLETILLSNNITLDIKYGKKEFFIYDIDSKKIYFYDFYIKELNYVIEYNGHVWHPNKNKLNIDEFNNWTQLISNKTSNDVFEYDLYKQSLLEKQNIQYDIVWDTDDINEQLKKLTNKIIELYEIDKK